MYVRHSLSLLVLFVQHLKEQLSVPRIEHPVPGKTGLLGQNHRAVFRDSDTMLEMRAVAAISGDGGPLVIEHAGSWLAGIHHRLNRQHHTFTQAGTLSTRSEVWNRGSSCSRVPMPCPTNSRTTL